MNTGAVPKGAALSHAAGKPLPMGEVSALGADGEGALSVKDPRAFDSSPSGGTIGGCIVPPEFLHGSSAGGKHFWGAGGGKRAGEDRKKPVGTA